MITTNTIPAASAAAARRAAEQQFGAANVISVAKLPGTYSGYYPDLFEVTLDMPEGNEGEDMRGRSIVPVSRTALLAAPPRQAFDIGGSFVDVAEPFVAGGGGAFGGFGGLAGALGDLLGNVLGGAASGVAGAAAGGRMAGPGVITTNGRAHPVIPMLGGRRRRRGRGITATELRGFRKVANLLRKEGMRPKTSGRGRKRC